MGKDYHFCSRCLGKYSGILAVFVLFLTGLRVPMWLHLWGMALFPLPATVDWLTQSMRMRESKNGIRLFTGFLFGNAWGLLFLSLICGMFLHFFYGIIILAAYLSLIGILGWKTNLLKNIH